MNEPPDARLNTSKEVDCESGSNRLISREKHGALRRECGAQ